MKKKKTQYPLNRSSSTALPNVFDSSPSTLFERSPSQEYIEAWTDALTAPSIEESKNRLSVLIFRLGEEWLALPTIFLKEVAHRRPAHQIPHRSNKVLLGVVNLNGELRLYVAIHELLGIQMDSITHSTRIPFQQNRMIAILKDEDLWVFPVDEIEGIDNWDLTLIENVPVNISQSSLHCIKGIMKGENRSIGLLDENVLFPFLRRSISETF